MIFQNTKWKKKIYWTPLLQNGTIRALIYIAIYALYGLAHKAKEYKIIY